jgi:hypothetical protein
MAFFLAFLIWGVGSLGPSFSATLGAALHATVTFGLTTTAMLLIADLATVAEFPKYRQLVLFNAYFVGLLSVAVLVFAMSFRIGYNAPEQRPVSIRASDTRSLGGVRHHSLVSSQSLIVAK